MFKNSGTENMADLGVQTQEEQNIFRGTENMAVWMLKYIRAENMTVSC